jgi:hypothetical protein
MNDFPDDVREQAETCRKAPTKRKSEVQDHPVLHNGGVFLTAV